MSHVELRDKLKQLISGLQPPAETWTPQQIIQWSFESFGGHVAIASAFGAGGMVIIDMTARLRGRDFRLFTVDTQFLFPETYHLMQRVEQKYGVAIFLLNALHQVVGFREQKLRVDGKQPEVPTAQARGHINDD